MLATKLPVNIQKGGQWIRAKVTEMCSDGRKVAICEEGGEPLQINTEGHDTSSGLSTLKEAIQRTFPTLTRLCQLTEDPDYMEIERKEQDKGRK